MAIIHAKKSPARFQGYKHINVYNMKYGTTENADGSSITGRITAFYTDTQLQGLATLGFDSIRLCFPGEQIAMAYYNNNAAQAAQLISDVLDSVQQSIRCGLKVNLDFHPGSQWAQLLITNSATTTTPLNVAHKQAWVGIAQAAVARGIAPENLMFGLLNEPWATTANVWSTSLQPDIFNAVRAVAPNHTIVITPEGSGISNLKNLNMSLFDHNIIVDIHTYEWWYFTYNGSTELQPSQAYFDSIDWVGANPDTTNLAAKIAATTANINADTTLDSTTKTTYINSATAFLTNYYTNYSEPARDMSIQTQARIWAKTNNIDPSQMYVGETGCTQRNDSRNTTVAARAAFFTHIRNWYESHGFRWGIFAADIASWLDTTKLGAFYIQKPDSGSGSVCNTNNVDPAIKTALGLI